MFSAIMPYLRTGKKFLSLTLLGLQHVLGGIQPPAISRRV